MKTSIEDLLEFAPAGTRPSLAMAKNMLANLLSEEQFSPGDELEICDEYFEGEYVPKLEEVEKWIDEKRREANPYFDEQSEQLEKDIENNDSHLWRDFRALLDRFCAKEITETELVDRVASLWSWMDESPFWAGSPDRPFWHVVKAQAAFREVSRAKIASIDAAADIKLEIMSVEIERAKNLLVGKVKEPSLDELDSRMDELEKKLAVFEQSEKRLIDSALRLGFLFRDAWWVEEHGDASIRGYQARETAEKAGKSGGENSSRKKQERIDVFLEQRAQLVKNNPALRDDQENDLSYRAIKHAQKKCPELFKRGNSKTSAVEYWDYIKSDDNLFSRYNELLLKTID